TQAAANMLRLYGDAELKARFLPPMVEGRWYGTMCLSEPHAGSSVGDIRTQAVPQPDGSYHLRGSKMWISAGEHELSENIVHMVLARIPGGPPGTKEVALALCLYTARLVDEQDTGEPAAQAEAKALLDLLTPIAKAWPSDYALAANDLAIQVLGGAGYTRDFPVERLWRDNRLNAIHE